MACPKCSPKLNPKRSTKGRFYAWRDHGKRVTRRGETINDIYALQEPDRAWRVAEPARLCSYCRKGFEAYIDVDGPFVVSDG